MIIQCEQCRTKYKLDDSKVADKGLKVRCARCRHVFSVAGMQSVPEGSAAFEQNAPVFQIEENLEVAAAVAQESAFSFEPETQPEVEASDQSDRLDAFSFADDDKQVAPDSLPSADSDFDFSLPSEGSDASRDRDETQNDYDAFDAEAFDFSEESGDEISDAAKPAFTARPLDFDDNFVIQGQTVTPTGEEFGGLDFSGDDMFGDVVATPAEEAESEPISFDVEMDGFADSMGVESSTASQSTSFASQDSSAENPFSLDDIDFGDELTSVAVQQVSPEELKPSQDLLFAPLAKTETRPALDSSADALEKTGAASVQEELPPLPITSRRKESPRKSGMLVFMGILIAVLVAFYSYWGYMTMNENKGKITQETGRITVRLVEASFVKNKLSGDLLVISGEAVNEYGKPRAAIQIKGIVFGADGKEVSSKNAFCGNTLSREQLATMDMDKIESTMANQFGDSLANMEVAPGKAIPFMIVIPKPPAGATDYGVEPAGSTVATGNKETEK